MHMITRFTDISTVLLCFAGISPPTMSFSSSSSFLRFFFHFYWLVSCSRHHIIPSSFAFCPLFPNIVPLSRPLYVYIKQNSHRDKTETQNCSIFRIPWQNFHPSQSLSFQNLHLFVSTTKSLIPPPLNSLNPTPTSLIPSLIYVKHASISLYTGLINVTVNKWKACDVLRVCKAIILVNATIRTSIFVISSKNLLYHNFQRFYCMLY